MIRVILAYQEWEKADAKPAVLTSRNHGNSDLSLSTHSKQKYEYETRCIKDTWKWLVQFLTNGIEHSQISLWLGPNHNFSQSLAQRCKSYMHLPRSLPHLLSWNEWVWGFTATRAKMYSKPVPLGHKCCIGSCLRAVSACGWLVVAKPKTSHDHWITKPPK